MARNVLFVLAITAVATEALRHRETSAANANPIRKVVTMLQMMKEKVEAEGEKETKLYDKYMCWCKTGASDLEKSIDAAKTKISDLESAIEESGGQGAQLEEDLKAHKADRAAAKKAMAEATALRKKEADAYAKVKADADANIAAMDKAIPAIENGMGAGFLQTSAANVLRKMLSKSSDSDPQEVLAFLSNSQSGEYAPQAGQIVGILKQMREEMSNALADATEAENHSIKTYDELMAAKTKEVVALSKMIEEKLERQAGQSVKLAEMKNDLVDTKEALAEDEKFLANMEEMCAAKQKEWEVRCKVRSEELVALADTIKVLNDDDALELFKKTLPSASAFVQVQVSSTDLRAKALAAILKGQRPGRNRLDFIALALSGKKVGFEKVIKMIDDLMATLKVEQEDDDNKKEYCNKAFDEADDKKKSLERSISDLDTEIAATNEGIAALTASIEALDAGLKELDKAVAEATEQRKEEHADFNDMIAQDSAAKEVLNFAKNRLNKFYNPKLYKPPAKRELSREDRIVVNEGGTLAPTQPPGGIAGTGITALAQEKPPPPPETFGAYEKREGENNGVIAMIDLLIKDLDKEMTEGEAEEKNAQAAYEKMMSDSADKRKADSTSLSEQTAAKAEAEAALQEQTASKKSTEKELAANAEYIHSLHGDCDWLLKFFDVRREARAAEVDSLSNAKAVLNGADYSL